MEGTQGVDEMTASEVSPSVVPFTAGGREYDWQQIIEALRGLRFGTVNIIVQDGVIVQIDRTEKRRLKRPAPSADSGACR